MQQDIYEKMLIEVYSNSKKDLVHRASVSQLVDYVVTHPMYLPKILSYIQDKIELSGHNTKSQDLRASVDLIISLKNKCYIINNHTLLDMAILRLFCSLFEFANLICLTFAKELIDGCITNYKTTYSIETNNMELKISIISMLLKSLRRPHLNEEILETVHLEILRNLLHSFPENYIKIDTKIKEIVTSLCLLLLSEDKVYENTNQTPDVIGTQIYSSSSYSYNLMISFHITNTVMPENSKRFVIQNLLRECFYLIVSKSIWKNQDSTPIILEIASYLFLISDEEKWINTQIILCQFHILEEIWTEYNHHLVDNISPASDILSFLIITNMKQKWEFPASLSPYRKPLHVDQLSPTPQPPDHTQNSWGSGCVYDDDRGAYSQLFEDDLMTSSANMLIVLKAMLSSESTGDREYREYLTKHMKSLDPTTTAPPRLSNDVRLSENIFTIISILKTQYIIRNKSYRSSSLSYDVSLVEYADCQETPPLVQHHQPHLFSFPCVTNGSSPCADSQYYSEDDNSLMSCFIYDVIALLSTKMKSPKNQLLIILKMLLKLEEICWPGMININSMNPRVGEELSFRDSRIRYSIRSSYLHIISIVCVSFRKSVRSSKGSWHHNYYHKQQQQQQQQQTRQEESSSDSVNLPGNNFDSRLLNAHKGDREGAARENTIRVSGFEDCAAMTVFREVILRLNVILRHEINFHLFRDIATALFNLVGVPVVYLSTDVESEDRHFYHTTCEVSTKEETSFQELLKLIIEVDQLGIQTHDIRVREQEEVTMMKGSLRDTAFTLLLNSSHFDEVEYLDHLGIRILVTFDILMLLLCSDGVKEFLIALPMLLALDECHYEGESERIHPITQTREFSSYILLDLYQKILLCAYFHQLHSLFNGPETFKIFLKKTAYSWNIPDTSDIHHILRYGNLSYDFDHLSTCRSCFLDKHQLLVELEKFEAFKDIKSDIRQIITSNHSVRSEMMFINDGQHALHTRNIYAQGLDEPQHSEGYGYESKLSEEIQPDEKSQASRATKRSVSSDRRNHLYAAVLTKSTSPSSPIPPTTSLTAQKTYLKKILSSFKDLIHVV